MLGTWLSLVFTIVLLIALYALSDRLQFLTNKMARGRQAFFGGTILLLLGSLWTALRFRPDYLDWFVTGAYVFLDVAHLLVIVAGLVFVVYGLSRFFDSLLDLQTDVEFREQKLDILENLQRDAREPYQFLELLNLSVKEICSTIPECAGAVFLIGRNRKQFILATSFGLTAEETSLFEYYPFGDNDITHAIDSGEVLLSGGFEFVDSSGEAVLSRYKAHMVLPLTSGMDRIGGVILLSTVERIFSQNDVKTLAPVGEWLAEKIKSARAARELAAVKKEKEEQQAVFNDGASRLDNASGAFVTSDVLNNLCLALKGFGESESVHLVASDNGSLEILGGSEPLTNIGEQYSEAIIGTIGRRKPAVVNQNAEDSDGRTFTNVSTLVFPLDGLKSNHALILRRQSSPFTFENFQLRILSIFSRLAVLALSKYESEKLDLTRRMGFDKVVQLLRLPSRLSFVEDPGFFARHLGSLLPQKTGVISFAAVEGELKLVDVFGLSGSLELEITVKRGEGFVGKAAESGTTVTISGKKEIERALGDFSDDNQILLSKLISEFGSPNYAIVSPLKAADQVAGVVAFFLEGISENERREWERLITLACGLYSMRLSLASMSQKQIENIPEERINQIVNAVNNNLAAVVGNAEILLTKNGLENELRAHLQSIVNEAEIASNQIKSLSVSDKEKVQSKSLSSPLEINLNDIAEKILKRSHVSENLYMVAGRAREIELKPGDISRLELAGNQIQELFTGAINKFAALAAEDDIITISTYERDNSVYLDISRHRRNLPPVESVAGFGSYQIAEEALKLRPSDKFLEKMAGSGGRFAYDRFSTSPSYLSFKFPLKKRGSISTRSSASRVEILAVDDQPVILELISAMCQTLGFRVTTALSGAEALSLAKVNKFDVILTDLAMPGMSGLELSRLIRIDNPDTPIILITGWEATIERSELESSGISDILYKPFRIEQLTNLVKAAATGQKA